MELEVLRAIEILEARAENIENHCSNEIYKGQSEHFLSLIEAEAKWFRTAVAIIKAQYSVEIKIKSSMDALIAELVK